ncbi:CHAT domain-containing protein [Mycena epipterygia]|nr:CHAT domain-containing protein [Mycena epipterygia]
MDKNPPDIVKLADNILADFHQSVNLSDLNNAVVIYKEAISAQDPLGLDTSRTLRQLSTAQLIHFHATGNVAAVQEAISLLRQVHVTHPSQRGSILGNLTSALRTRFETRDNQDLDSAMGLLREVLDLHPAPHPNRVISLNNLATVLELRFQRRGDAGDLDGAIELHRETLDLCPAHHADRGSFLNNLGSVLCERYLTRGDPGDLDSAIVLHCEALDLHPPPHPGRASSLSSLAAVLCHRFQTRGDGADLDKAAELHREALYLYPPPHLGRSSSLTNLGNVLHQRFQRRGDVRDLDDAIEYHRQALDLCPVHHADRSSFLNNLGAVLFEQYLTRGDTKDLDSAIVLHCEALDLRPAPHPDRSSSLTNLANAIHRRFQTRGEAADLDNVIELHREAVNLCPAPHPKCGASLNNMANVLHERFKTRGDPVDLDNAIALLQEVLDLHPAPHPDRGTSLNNMAHVLYQRFRTRGDAEDLDNAIRQHREALHLHPAPHPHRGMSLNNLAIVLNERFQRTQDPADLDHVIELHHEALDLRPVPHPDRGMSLNNLASVLNARFQRTRDPADLDHAIQLHHEVLDLRPAPHLDHGSSLNNLANVLRQQLQITGDAGDLDNVIELHNKVLDLRPETHPDRGDTLTNLANVLCDMFHAQGEPVHLDNALQMQHEALAAYPPSHPHRGTALMSLAIILIHKYDISLDLNIMNEGVIAFRESSVFPLSSVSQRCIAAATWARYAEERNHDSTLEGYETSIDLLPQLAMLALDIQSRHKALTLSFTSGLASKAATYASQNNEIGKAVEFLEAGHSVFWSQALQLHTSVDDLQKAHPELAQKILDISRKLEAGSHRDLDKDDANYRKLNAEWTQTVNEIHQQVGFERFLQPKLINEIETAALHGPIIILNASPSVCAALVITLSGDAQFVKLDNMPLDLAQFLVNLLRLVLSGSRVQISQLLKEARGQPFRELQDRLLWKLETGPHYDPNVIFAALLEILWERLVQPVFKVLNLKARNSSDPSRLWWCPTGPFTFLPIHAAGIYGRPGMDCVSDYVVSSYTPTLNSLLDPPSRNSAPFKMTAMIQPTTYGCSDLPATVEELSRIKQQVPPEWLTALGDGTPATVGVALHHLQGSSLVHFACHGTQDLENPLESGLHLTDGRLKVSQIMQTKSQKKSMSLAFLSACETAKGDETVPDEAMHLAATLLFSGFQSVVATMWTMADPDGPKIAESFYEHLFKGCDAKANPPILPDLTKAAEALHVAVTKLRADPSVPFSRWVPFVHYGL